MNYRSDLAIELAQDLQGTGTDIEGLPEGLKAYSKKVNTVEITTVEIQTDEMASRLQKPKGRYITIETAPLWKSSPDMTEEICAAADSLRNLLPEDGNILVVGLGNSGITPDALGPQVIGKILATRHIGAELAESIGLGSLRKVSAIAPGVMGQTGIETGEIVSALVKHIQPVAVIVVDALAAREIERLGCTIQISDSGISPGSGVLNARKELCEKTLGVPVFSIGVPTVVDATTMAYDLLDEKQIEKKRELFDSSGSQMMVTPREIDLLIGHGAKFISLAINKALQPELSLEDITYLCA